MRNWLESFLIRDLRLMATLDRLEGPGESVVATLGQRETFESLLGGIVQDRGWCSDVALRSSVDRLGFSTYILLDLGTLGRLRCDIWPARERGSLEDVHDNGFALYSSMITGSVINHLFDFDESGREYEHFQPVNFEDPYGDLKRLAKVRLRETANFRVVAGESYSLGPKAIYGLEAGPDLCIYLSLECRYQDEPVGVFVPDGGDPFQRKNRIGFSLEDTRSRLAALLQDLQETLADGKRNEVSSRKEGRFD